MKIYNTSTAVDSVPVYMLVYGTGGIGKSTFASTAPGPFMADCEGGAKFFGRRGISMPVAVIETWGDFADPGKFVDMAIKDQRVETIIVDPIGELMEKCKNGLEGSGFVTSDGSPTLRGWGEMSKRMKFQFRKLRDSGKNVILIAHVEEKEDEGRLVKRPKIQTKISEDIINMVDVVGMMIASVNDKGTIERVITFDPTNDKISAKDRTGSLPTFIEPQFSLVLAAINAPLNTETIEPSSTPEKPHSDDSGKAETPSLALDDVANSNDTASKLGMDEITPRDKKLQAAKDKIEYHRSTRTQ